MAVRPVFTPSNLAPFICEHMLDFQWHAGFAVSQKQKSIAELHQVIVAKNIGKRPLEISSKSEDALGVALSAFNLMIQRKQKPSVALENVFQSAKIFERGGPFRDLLEVSPLEAKRDPRLKESGNLTGFRSRDEIWPIEPKTLFYDWIYINALHRNSELAQAIFEYDAFTDIEFNPSKSFNCQARSVALYVALTQCDQLEKALEDSAYYRQLVIVDDAPSSSIPVQQSWI